jgi:predicted NUDIX family NTP pyrophosphohydrolase
MTALPYLPNERYVLHTSRYRGVTMSLSVRNGKVDLQVLRRHRPCAGWATYENTGWSVPIELTGRFPDDAAAANRWLMDNAHAVWESFK